MPLEIVPAASRCPATKSALSTRPATNSASGGKAGSSSADLRRLRGYFRNEAKTRELFHDGWLDSGDRAYMAGGDVCITGRIKDIIIRAGRHIYPQEIEEAVAEIPGIRKGCVAVFGVTDRASGTERVVVLAETRETDPAARAALQARAQEIASDIAGTPPDEIVLAPPRTVPKTSSGKIRRSAAKELYESGHIDAPQRALWLQILRLTLAGIAPQLVRQSRVLARDVLCHLVVGRRRLGRRRRMARRHDPAAP